MPSPSAKLLRSPPLALGRKWHWSQESDAPPQVAPLPPWQEMLLQVRGVPGAFGVKVATVPSACRSLTPSTCAPPSTANVQPPEGSMSLIVPLWQTAQA